ncbi:MAG: NADH-quinone oxidoreductase subunit NuoH [Anaerolineae bacterium]
MEFLEFVKDLFINIGLWFQGLVVSIGLPDVWVHVITLAAGAFVLALVPVMSLFFLIWFERKIVARIADRLGPNNSGAYGGPYGLLQVFGDAIKMFTKEDVIPAAANRWVFNIAPLLIFAIAVLIWAVIPLGKGVIGSDLSIGIFYVLSLGSGGMVAILMAGWGSNNKYALLGALRGIATLISYEIPQVLAVLTVVMVAGSFSMQDIIASQDVAFLFALPLTALLFVAAALPELGRRPFDLVEADSEIVAGYFIEYSGIKFGLFFLAEFMNQAAMSALFAILFLGGWRGPWVDQVPVLGTLWLVLKIFVVILVIQFFQYTLPRLRIDQILGFSWKFLTPLALVNVCVVALVGKAVPHTLENPWIQVGALLGANVLLALAVLGVLAIAGRRAQQQLGAGG